MHYASSSLSFCEPPTANRTFGKASMFLCMVKREVLRAIEAVHLRVAIVVHFLTQNSLWLLRHITEVGSFP